MRTVPLLGISALALLALAACGTQSGGSGPVTSLSPSASAPAGAGGGGTALTIVFKDTAAATPQTWTLTCDPTGGTHPDATGACAALAAVDDPFKPLDKTMACTEIYGGPQTATVTGTYKGSAVHASFARTNGCEIAQWDKLHAALGSAGGS
jgi:Subtilisin inhibitor-like